MTAVNVSVLGRVGTIRVFENGEGGPRTTANGKVVTFGVAVDQRRQQQEGQQDPLPPVWYNFRAFGPLADILAQHLQKGRLVYVSGAAPRVRAYQVERQIQIPNVGAVKFTDTQTVIEYAVRDFSFADAPTGVLVGTIVGADTQVAEPAAAAPVVNIDPADVPF